MLVFIGSLLLQVRLGSRGAKRAVRNVKGALDPGRELLDRMSLAPPHVRKTQQEWLAEAERG